MWLLGPEIEQQTGKEHDERDFETDRQCQQERGQQVDLALALRSRQQGTDNQQDQEKNDGIIMRVDNSLKQQEWTPGEGHRLRRPRRGCNS